MYCSLAGFTVLNHLLEFAETNVHWVGNAIQPFHTLSPPSPLALNLSQHHGLFQWVAKVLEFRLQHQSIQLIFRVDFLYDWLVWPPCCLSDSQESSVTPQFESVSSWVLSLLHGSTVQLSHPYMSTGKTITLTVWTFDDPSINISYYLGNGDS